MLMHRIILPSVAWRALSYFSTLSHKRHGFRGKVYMAKKYVLTFSATFVSNLSHSKKNLAKYMYVGLHVKYVILCQILTQLAFSWQIFEKFSDIVGVVGKATLYRMYGPGVESCFTRPDRGAHPAYYTMSTGYFPEVKRLGGCFGHPPEIKERVELCIYSPSGPSWPVLGWTFTFTQTSSFIQILPVGAMLFDADRRADVNDDADSRFSQFCARIS
jgi:hypothetical protein